jgi:hypothetical protein
MPQTPSVEIRSAWRRAPAPEDLEAILGSIRDGVLVLDEERRKVLALNERLASWLSAEVRAKVLDTSPSAAAPSSSSATAPTSAVRRSSACGGPRGRSTSRRAATTA